MFQCPTSGFFLFYVLRVLASWDNSKCFNALLRASFFSTFSGVEEFSQKIIVSMPYFGLLSFLHCYDVAVIKNGYMFQCPTSGFFLFYGELSMTNDVKEALFQCPTSGFFLFYLCGNKKNNAKRIGVSMPYFGLLSFLRYASAAIDFTGFSASSL